ncbi:MAG TPA: DotU family type IV/VI secretion system protein [Bryobacteraceae bacterium]|nr:DotU family type IV/VI secretion system protein [Bryobacteraceae bacterium]
MTQADAAAAARRPENLALILQEVLTVVVRYRANRQPVSDAESFRHHVREALKAAAQQARSVAGYSSDDVKMGIFAVVAFLDESILNSRNPLFADWPRKPMQEEMFGHHIAGEVFFRNLDELLGKDDSHALADVLEVYYLCMLLGFAGRYVVGNRGELKNMMDRTAEKIRRIRGKLPELSPCWQIPPEQARVYRDAWVKRFAMVAVACLVLAVAMFFTYKIALGSGVSDLQAVAARGKG